MKQYEYYNSLTRPVYNPFPNKPLFLRACSTSLLKTLWEKEKLSVTSSISFSHGVFYQFGDLPAIYHQIWNCRLPTPSVWNSIKCVVWEWVNND